MFDCTQLDICHSASNKHYLGYDTLLRKRLRVLNMNEMGSFGYITQSMLLLVREVAYKSSSYQELFVMTQSLIRVTLSHSKRQDSNHTIHYQTIYNELLLSQYQFVLF